MACLDGMNRDRRGKVRLRLDIRRLTLVRRDGEVFERDRRFPERLRRLGAAAEVEPRTPDRGAAERLPESDDVPALVRADDPGLLLQGASKRAEVERLRVEGRLQVLERQ